MTTFAVTSDDFRRITGHAGRSRRFLIYHAANGHAADEHVGDGHAASAPTPRMTQKLDLPADYALHDWGDRDGHPVFDVDVLLSGSAGSSFVRKLEDRGIEVVLTSETDPIRAIRAYTTGTLTRAGAHHCLTQGIRRAVSSVLR